MNSPSLICRSGRSTPLKSIWPQGCGMYHAQVRSGAGDFSGLVTGAARVALAAGVPLVPAAVHGTEHARPLARWRVQFGPPVPLDDLESLPPREAVAEATRRLWLRIGRLEDAVAGGDR